MKPQALLILIFVLHPICYASRDVNSVSFRGDSTLMGMRIEESYAQNGAFLVVTTGARYEYVPGELKIYQGLGNDIGRRLVATISIKDVNEFEKVESNNDRVLLWSETLNIGIYGDSTCIFAPKTNLTIECKGNFKPDYEGRLKGELLLIDDLGGMEIYPQRYEAGYEIKQIELGRQDWTADYQLKAGQRVMIAAFPGRPFDWEKSFKCNFVFTSGGMGLGFGNPYGQMPPDDVIESWSKHFNIIVMFFTGLYKNSVINGIEQPAGPYVVDNKKEFHRFVAAAHKNNMKVALYGSFFYYARKHGSLDGFYEEIKALKDEFNTDGIYIDGPMFDEGSKKIDDKIGNWEMMRRIRDLFGSDGVIVFHDTQLGSPVGTVPNIDVHCDMTLNGEGVPVESLKDPYVQYQIRKYGISNSIALWEMVPYPKHIGYKNALDALLKMNGRERWGFFPAKPTPKDNMYIWPTQMPSNLQYYFDKMKILEQEYIDSKRKSKP